MSWETPPAPVEVDEELVVVSSEVEEELLMKFSVAMLVSEVKVVERVWALDSSPEGTVWVTADAIGNIASPAQRLEDEN